MTHHRALLRIAWVFDRAATYADQIAQGIARFAGEADASSDRGGVFLRRPCSGCNGRGYAWCGDVDICGECGGPGEEYISIGEALE